MLNQEDFIKRLHKIFEHYSLTAAIFANEIKVQRSSISHLLSGRNKPSLEFVLKIVDRYKDVTLDWLLYGNGSFPEKSTSPLAHNTKSNNDLFSNPEPKLSSNNTKILEQNNLDIKKTTPSQIERIVVFYKDGTFKEYLEK